jgi:L-aminopeptidase/D-esterase-like protein
VITDVPGIRVGHATDSEGLTGVTVVLCDRPATCAVELRGGANDVTGLDHLDPRHLVPTVDGVVLGGGSRYGGEAIWGVMRYLEERGIGFPAGPTVVPHVPGAFLFDLNVGGGRARPTREMGYAAATAAGGSVVEGNVGAGTGASVGKLFGLARAMRGGLGTASLAVGAAVVGALVAVNALGDVRDPDTGRLIAGTRDAPGGVRLVDSAMLLRSSATLQRFAVAEHTTIGVVATSARLTKPEAAKIAALGMLGFARALSPPHTAFDGDTLFVLSLGDTRTDLTRLGLTAADAVAQAIVRGVRAATPLPGLPAVRDLHPATNPAQA